MITLEQMKQYADSAKSMCEHVGPRLDYAIPQIVGIVRNGKPYAWLFPSRQDDEVRGSDPLLRVAYQAVAGLHPEAVVLVSDTYTAKSPTKHDGSEWGVGGMQYAAEHGTVDADLVSEALALQAMGIDDSQGMAMLPYETVLGSFGVPKYVWGEPMIETTENSGFRSEGHLVDVIRDAYSKPRLVDMMTAREVDERELDAAAYAARRDNPLLSDIAQPRMTAEEALEYVENFPEEAFAHQFCAVAKMMWLPTDTGILLSISDETIAEIFNESLGRHPNINMERLR